MSQACNPIPVDLLPRCVKGPSTDQLEISVDYDTVWMAQSTQDVRGLLGE